MRPIDFKTKISAQRPYGNPANGLTSQQLQRAFESDRGRIINSAAIRRLQQKTQVFPLEKNAAVRSRLTHSLEVQQVGRFIVQSIFASLSNAQQSQYGLIELDRCIESLVEMSCLMHDIGNPAFGHFGEQAINQWFEEHLLSLASAANSNVQREHLFEQRPELAVELQQFEGNAQAIRLIHSLLNLNLSYSQAAGILKYTRAATMLRSSVAKDKSYLMKKVGFYHSESAYIKKLCDHLKIAPGCRHPLSYIMEAADDISYCLADIEDAVEKGILNTDQLSHLLIKTYCDVLKNKFRVDDPLAIEKMQEYIARANKSQNFFISLRVSLSHPLVKHASKQFIDNIEGVFHGSFNNALLEDNSQYHAITETLKQIAIQQVFCHPEVEKLELQGYRIICGLLDFYKPLLALKTGTFEKVLNNKKDAPLIAKHLVKRLPEKHLDSYNKAIHAIDKSSSDYSTLEFYHRCRLIQDYISGMTDQFAYDEYRSIMVID